MGLPAHKQTATDARLGALGTLPGGGWQAQPRAALAHLGLDQFNSVSIEELTNLPLSLGVEEDSIFYNLGAGKGLKMAT